MESTIQRFRAEGGIDGEAEGHYRVLSGIESTAGPHTHDFFEFFLIASGAVCHCINGKKETLEEGALVFMRPQDVHYYEKLPGKDFRLINLSYYRRTVTELFAYLGEGFPHEAFLSAEHPLTVRLAQQDKLLLQRRLEKLYRIPQHDKRWFRTELRSLLSDVYVTHMMPNLFTKPDERPLWFVQLCLQLKNPACYQDGIAAMQRISGKSHAHLCRVFKQWEQLTPLQYMNRVKLQYAENLLLRSDWSILDISLEAGFHNLGYFYKTFKSLYGQTPLQYRRLHRSMF